MLRSLDRDLFVLDHPLVLPGGMAIGSRMTVVRLSDGGLFLHSPVPLDAAAKSELEAIGPVRFVVAPNLFHHFYVNETIEAFPDAELHVAPGLAAKKKDLPAHVELGEEPAPGWKADLDQVWVHGAPPLEEVVFFHRASRTVLFTDLCFNVQHAEGLATKLFWKLNGAIGRFGPTRLARFFFKDKKTVREGIDRVLEWDFDRATVTHGEVRETGAREATRQAYARL